MRRRPKMQVMPGLGDKQAEREVRKYVDENTLAMLLMNAVNSNGGKCPIQQVSLHSSLLPSHGINFN